ncbi:MAG: hypothetical protein M1812_005073 [Candelaria pacifica]|nr:MAG: hypothetical protein M1812_005073 [Candelaria pacifica]
MLLPLLFFSFPLLLNAASLTAFIPSSPQIPSFSALPASTTASLETLGASYTTSLTRNGRFTFRNITSGSYLLTVHCRTFAFAPLRVDVASDDVVEVWQTFRGNEWDNKGEKKGLPVELQLLGAKEYYQAREGFSPMSYLKSPMILIGIAGMALVFGMPYLLENMDPEMRAEFEEQQKKSPLTGGMTGGNSLQNFDMAAWMAGKTENAGATSGKDDGGGSSRKRRG